MSFHEFSFTCMQKLPQTDMLYSVVYHRGGVYFHFSLRDVKRFMREYDATNALHQHTYGTIIRLLATGTHFFDCRGDAETWLRTKYGLVDLQWQIRRVEPIEAVLLREVKEIHVTVYEYPTIEQGTIILAKNEKEFTAKIIGFSDMPHITMPLELALHQFPYDEIEYI